MICLACVQRAPSDPFFPHFSEQGRYLLRFKYSKLFQSDWTYYMRNSFDPISALRLPLTVTTRVSQIYLMMLK